MPLLTEPEKALTDPQALRHGAAGTAPAETREDPENLAAAGRHAEAVEGWMRRLEANRTDPKALLGLALSLQALGRGQPALKALDLLLLLQPESAEGLFHKGNLCHRMGRLDEAVGLFLKLVQAHPQRAEGFQNLGSVLLTLGHVKEAATAFIQARQLAPGLREAQSSYLACLDYRSGLVPAEVVAEHVAWGRATAAAIQPFAPGNLRPAEPGVLRLGFLSGDFHGHPVMAFLGPLLRHRDRASFSYHAYSTGRHADAVTARVKAEFDGWRELAGESDEAIARAIRADRIDLLVDLGGHTASGRPAVLAWQPAPVQMTWLGYPNTTGLAQVDFRVLDAVAAPAGGVAELGAERPLRLPRGYHVYEPPADAPEPGELPADRNGYITFGCCNRAPKWSEAVSQAWITLLQALPEARLVLKCKSLADAGARETAARRFTAAGISAGRLRLLPWTATQRESLELYREIDVALDTFPYAGTTTTCEALWMGVPVVTWAGDAVASRVGLSLLTQAGLPDLAATDAAGYVRTALAMVRDRNRLRRLRSELRDRLRGSALLDGSGFARAFEGACRTAWQEKIGVHLAPAKEGMAAASAAKGTAAAEERAAPQVLVKTSTGVLYVVWGGVETERFVERSREALRVVHPELPVEVRRLPAGSTLLDKAALGRYTPFGRTLLLDIDTVPLDTLDFGFAMADRHGLACCICECPWARRYGGLEGDLVEYNTGVLFFTEKAAPVLAAWERLAPAVDSSIQMIIDGQRRVMPRNDQASFAQAVAEWDRLPFILPMNWNFRPQWHRSLFGPIKIWHDYREVPAALRRWNQGQTGPDAIIQYLELS